MPAWCDRILYERSDKCKGNLDLLHYVRKETLFSDHRPVTGLFNVQVCSINQEKKNEVEKKQLDQLFGANKPVNLPGEVTNSQNSSNGEE